MFVGHGEGYGDAGEVVVGSTAERSETRERERAMRRNKGGREGGSKVKKSSQRRLNRVA